MSSKKDLVEAHAFNRRRLVTAFVSGAPGGREVEPARPGRTLVGGVVLAGLIVAGAAVSGFLQQPLPEDWTEQGLVVGEGSGSRFLASEGTLYPVINTTSARLALPPGEFEPTIVPDEEIATVTPGATLGIQGAPDVLPDQDSLVPSGWSACTDGQQNIKTRLASQPGAQAAPSSAVVVEAEGDSYVIAGEHRYPVAPKDEDATLRALGLDREAEREVPGLWLDLITPGSALEPFALDDAGEPLPDDVPAPPGADTIGSVVRVDGLPNLLTEEGLLPISDFAYRMYTSSPPPGTEDVTVTRSEVSDLDTDQATDPPYPSDWPEEIVTPLPGASACLMLFTSEEQVGRVFLANPTDISSSPSPEGAGTRQVEVENGHGALVRATGGGAVDRGTAYLIDSSGTRYPLGEPVATTLAHLGYEGVTPAPVPLPWMNLFPDGPTLDRQAAGAPAVTR